MKWQIQEINEENGLAVCGFCVTRYEGCSMIYDSSMKQ